MPGFAQQLQRNRCVCLRICLGHVHLVFLLCVWWLVGSQGGCRAVLMLVLVCVFVLVMLVLQPLLVLMLLPVLAALAVVLFMVVVLMWSQHNGSLSLRLLGWRHGVLGTQSSQSRQDSLWPRSGQRYLARFAYAAFAAHAAAMCAASCVAACVLQAGLCWQIYQCSCGTHAGKGSGCTYGCMPACRHQTASLCDTSFVRPSAQPQAYLPYTCLAVGGGGDGGAQQGQQALAPLPITRLSGAALKEEEGLWTG